MNRCRAAGVVAAIAVGWASPASAANPPPEQTTLIKKLFGPSTPKPAGPTVRSGPVTPKRPITVSGSLPPKVLADALQAEQEAYLRRVSVCTELRRVALERGDEALLRQADELERQFGTLYNSRVAALGVARTKAPLPEPTARSFENSTDVTLAAKQLVPPAAPVPGTTTAAARIKPREVAP